MEGVPGRYFDCPSGMGRLSVKACAENYQLGRDRRQQYARLRCQGCALGAQHAVQACGLARSADAGIPLLSGRRVCPRCLRPAQRIIGAHLCVSCYNRQREVLVGVNRHGKRPSTPAPKPIRVMVMESDRLSLVRVDRAYSLLEATILAARRSGARVFGWCAQAGLGGRHGLVAG